MAEALPKTEAAAIIGSRTLRLWRAIEITDSGAGLRPCHQPAPRLAGHTHGQHYRAFGQILRQRTAGCKLRIAKQPHRDVRPEGKIAQLPIGLDLAVAESVVPARGEERIEPDRSPKSSQAPLQIGKGFARFRCNRWILGVASQSKPRRGELIQVHYVVRPAQL